MAKYRIVLTGGGSGGHIFPLIAVACKLREQLQGDVEFLYIGSEGPIEAVAMHDAGIPTRFIRFGKWRRYASGRNFTDIFRMILGFFQSLWLLLRYMPDVVFSKGGAVAVPVVVVAWLYRIPILTHESDAMPGTANRIIGKFADRIAIGYPTAKAYFAAGKTVYTGNPVRGELLAGNLDRARTRFGLLTGKPVLTVLGGSQGARILNQALVRAARLLSEHFQIVHQTGSEKYDETVGWLEELGIHKDDSTYRAVAFLQTEEMADLLSVTDIVICRSGAGTIAEVAATGRVAAILVPHSAGSNEHQRMNAYEVARSGGAVVLDENNLGENFLFNKAVQLWQEESVRVRMIEALKQWYRADAADVIAQGIVGLLKK